jgi:hypothetical protein
MKTAYAQKIRLNEHKLRNCLSHSIDLMHPNYLLSSATAAKVHTAITELHLSGEGNVKEMLLALDLAGMHGKNIQDKHQMSKKEKFMYGKTFITKKKKQSSIH